MRLVVVCLALSVSAARAEPCKIDRKRYGHIVGSGFGEALVCAGAQLPDIWIRYASDGTITAIHWAERQGEKLDRTIQLYDSGQIAMIAHDSRIKGGFFKQTRGISYQSFPRRFAMRVEKDPAKLRVAVRDAAGHTWLLAGAPARNRVSWSVTSIDGVAQNRVPIGLTLAGIVGVDLARVRAFFLETRQPDLSGLANKRSPKYLATKSVFHDPSGNTCLVANEELYVQSTRDPDDKAEADFRFATDDDLDAFLAEACPKLDRAALDQSSTQ